MSEQALKEVDDIKGDIKDIRSNLEQVRIKVFNGFGERIETVADSHADLKAQITRMWVFISGALLTILGALIGVFMIVWSSESHSEIRIQELETIILDRLSDIPEMPLSSYLELPNDPSSSH